MSYWNSLQNTMSGTFNIVENKTLEHRNETEKQVSMYTETKFWSIFILP